MVRIRLRRVGSRHQPSYRLIVADEESPRDGRFLENLGHHNPRTFPATTVVDEGRVFYWLGGGAQAPEAARRGGAPQASPGGHPPPPAAQPQPRPPIQEGAQPRRSGGGTCGRGLSTTWPRG